MSLPISDNVSIDDHIRHTFSFGGPEEAFKIFFFYCTAFKQSFHENAIKVLTFKRRSIRGAPVTVRVGFSIMSCSILITFKKMKSFVYTQGKNCSLFFGVVTTHSLPLNHFITYLKTSIFKCFLFRLLNFLLMVKVEGLTYPRDPMLDFNLLLTNLL